MKNTLLPFTVTLALLCGVVSCKKKEKESDSVPSIEVASPMVDSVTLHKVIPGSIQAASKVDVVARVTGRIISVNYKPGQYVNKGQLLFTIESTKYRDAVAQARAALDEATAKHDYYSRQYEAMKKALASDAVSQMDVIQSESALRQASAAISTARAQLEEASTNLAYCSVTAPVSGHITDNLIDSGNVVSGEMSPVTLATIYNDSEMEAVFDLSDIQYQDLLANGNASKEGLLKNIPLQFKQELPRQFSADLYYTSPAVNSTTGTFLLKGKVTNNDNILKDGMFVSVSLPYRVEPKAVIVRDASIGTDQSGKYLYLVNDSDKVVYTPVEVGELYHDTLRIITKGIKPGERYVTKALLTVRAGMKVNPVDAGGHKK